MENKMYAGLLGGVSLAGLVLGGLSLAATTPSAAPAGLKYSTPSASAGQKIATGMCAGCHGATGVSQTPTVPSLAGQNQLQLRGQLDKFRKKLRPSNVMQGIAARLTDQQIADLAAYFSAQKIGPAWKADPTARKSGKQLFDLGDPKRNIVACAVCHSSDGRGLEAHDIASVTNLPPEYAYNVLKEFHDAPSFGGDVPAETMRIIVKPLTDKDLKNLAAYISSMK